MHIHRLTLEKFRGAVSLSLDLDERLNVFVGVNGSGKSTVLDATVILLSWLVNRIKSSSASGRPIMEDDIKNDESSANLRIVLGGIETRPDDKLLNWNIAKVRKRHAKKEIGTVLADLSEVAKRIQCSITDSNGDVNIPVFVYYPVNRSVLDIPLKIRKKHSFGLLSAYDESLTSVANFRAFFEWFREREDLENENRKYLDDPIKPCGFQFPNHQLEAVRDALTQFIPEFKNLTVRRNPLRMEVDKNGERLIINQLSDGEKCLIAMVGDLARRMAIANPLLDNPQKGEGIVLIDEIDLHLHPKWQRIVIPRLTKVFSRVQFIISTHSPHVITHVEPKNLFLLSMTKEGLEALRPSESYGMTVERILEDLMGLDTTRPKEVQEDLRQIYMLIDSDELKEAEMSIAQLEDRIGDDPELDKAKVLIKGYVCPE